tara:strand:- start:410 stop:1354 length:945 start_codon:yes stop_codon:yes gene_type:complete
MIKKLNIFITGGAGYIGSMLATDLVKLGHIVTVLDNLTYTKNSLSHLKKKKNFKLIVGNVLNKTLMKKLIKNQDFIIPLAGLVGAPLCDRYPKLAKSVNLNSIIFIRKCLKKNQKVVFATTNSGYGIGKKNKFCTERSKLNPISLYGRTKVQAEKEIMKFKNSISFRLATVFGKSYRMRTDLLVNNFVWEAMKNKKLILFEPHFRRNYIHVKDIVKVFIFSIKNFNKLKSNVYNVGLSSANLTKLSLARKIKKKVKNLKIEINNNKTDPDKRDYFVSNKKIEKKGFKAKFSIENGISELLKTYKSQKFRILNNY